MRTDRTQLAKKQASPTPNGAELDRRYGKIGISAVAAAMRYCSERDLAGSIPATRPATRRESAHG